MVLAAWYGTSLYLIYLGMRYYTITRSLCLLLYRFGNWVGEDRQHYRPTYPMPSYLQPYSPSLGGGRPPSRIVIQAPPPGESVFLRPEDGYQPAPVPMGSYRQ